MSPSNEWPPRMTPTFTWGRSLTELPWIISCSPGGDLRWLFSFQNSAHKRKGPAPMLEPERGRMRAGSRW